MSLQSIEIELKIKLTSYLNSGLLLLLWSMYGVLCSYPSSLLKLPPPHLGFDFDFDSFTEWFRSV